MVAAIGLVCLGGPAAAAAAEFPPYEGGIQYPVIHTSAEPEDYTWELQLDEDQELRVIDERRAGVYYAGEEILAFTITAEPAHDATGAAVQTTIAVTGPRLVTFTVHHHAGNPAAGGALFAYPISPGEGYETGYAPGTMAFPPPTPPPFLRRFPPALFPSSPASRCRLSAGFCAGPTAPSAPSVASARKAPK